MEKSQLVINQSNFIEWYFADEVDILGDVIKGLKENGRYFIDVHILFDGLGYVPPHILEDGCDIHLDDEGEIDLSKYDDEVEFV